MNPVDHNSNPNVEFLKKKKGHVMMIKSTVHMNNKILWLIFIYWITKCWNYETDYMNKIKGNDECEEQILTHHK